jgi:PEP-CTERM motif
VKKFTLVVVSGFGLLSGAYAQEGQDAPLTQVAPAPVLPVFTPQTVRPGRDRFNNSPALTLDGLVETLKTNATFRKNLSKHFAVPEDRLVGFVADALVPQVLSTDSRVQNYGVTKSGLIYHKNTTLKKGTRVWGLRDGTPILKWDCSNPLLLELPVKRRVPKPTPVGLWKERGITPPEAALLPPTELAAPIGITLALEKPTDPLGPPTTLTPNPPPNDPNNPTPPRSSSIITRSGLPLLPIAGVFGLVVRSQTAPSSVPEPATVALLGLGALGLLAARRRR